MLHNPPPCSSLLRSPHNENTSAADLSLDCSVTGASLLLCATFMYFHLLCTNGDSTWEYHICQNCNTQGHSRQGHNKSESPVAILSINTRWWLHSWETPELNVSVCRSGIPWHRTARKKLGDCASCEAERGNKRSIQHPAPVSCYISGRQTIRGQWPMAIQ